MVKVVLKPITDGLKSVDLPVGKTVLGRGPLLGCTDKKVSRNHAVLDVTTKGRVFITPIHVNPCFYRTKSDDALKTMKKDHVQQLYPGDIISLLPHTFEYEICLDTSPVNSLGEKDNIMAVPIKQLPKSSKELAVTRDEPIEENTLVEKNDNKEFNPNADKDSFEDGENDKSPDSNKDTPEEEDDGEDENDKKDNAKPANIASRKEERVPTAKPKTATRHRRTLPDWLIKCAAQAGSERKEKVQARAAPSSAHAPTPVRIRASKTSGGDSKQGVSRSARKNRQTRQKISLDDFVVSEDDQWNSEASDKPTVGRSKSDDSDWESEKNSSSDWEVKKRKRRGRGGRDSSESDWGATNLRKRSYRRDDSDSASDWETGRRKKVVKKSKGRRAKKKSDSDDSNDEPARRRRTSTSRTEESKRSPCMYGKKCYRRQQQHISKFSHPGDSDYESQNEMEEDDETSREECPYGVDCYRKNTQHRNQFSHTRKVRPKREAAKKAGKKKNEDDEDENEDSRDMDLSFENDSDAYAPESEGSGGGSGTEDLVKNSKKVLMNRDRKKAV